MVAEGSKTDQTQYISRSNHSLATMRKHQHVVITPSQQPSEGLKAMAITREELCLLVHSGLIKGEFVMPEYDYDGRPRDEVSKHRRFKQEDIDGINGVSGL